MYKYPYGDSQQLNLDWILSKLKELEEAGLGLDLEEVSNALISLTYNTSTAYRRYDYAFLNGKLYRCLSDTSGAFDPAAWQEALIGDDLAVLTRWINAIDAAAVVDVKFDTSGTNGKFQQKYHDEYHDVVEVDYTPVQNSKRPLSSNAGYKLNGAINDRISIGDVNISALTDNWLLTARDGVYKVTGTSRIDTFIEDADGNYGILTITSAPHSSYDYGYITFHSTTGKTFYRDFTTSSNTITWRTALQQIAIESEISALNGAINPIRQYGVITKLVDTGTLDSTTCVKYGHICFVSGRIHSMVDNTGEQKGYFLLPEGFRPTSQIRCNGYVRVESLELWVPVIITLQENGVINAGYSASQTISQVAFSGTFYIE